MTNKIKVEFVTIILSFALLLTPTTCYALNNDYVNGDFKDEMYWSEVEEIQVRNNNGNFNGIVKYIIDEENGCFYLYFSFIDLSIDTQCTENITIDFTIKNELNNHHFGVDKNGFTENSNNSIDDYFDIVYCFDKSSCKIQGGDIYIGFELKDKSDKSMLSFITCQYYCADYERQTILENVELNMSKNTNNSNSDQTDLGTIKNTSKNSNSVENYSESSTKFSGSYTTTKTNDENEDTKFSSNSDSNYSSKNLHSKNEENFETNTKAITSNNSSNISNFTQERTDDVKIMIVVGAVIIACGIICVVAGIILSHKKDTKKITEE